MLYRWAAEEVVPVPQVSPEGNWLPKLCETSSVIRTTSPPCLVTAGSEGVLGVAAKHLDVSHSLQKHRAYLRTDFLFVLLCEFLQLTCRLAYPILATSVTLR